LSAKAVTNHFATFGLLFGATVWGIIWYPYRLLEQAGIPGVASSFYTYALAVGVGLVLFAQHWRGIRQLPPSTIWLMLAAGWTNLAYVLAIIDGEVMRVMLLFYLSPLWTLILAHYWLREHTGKLGMIAIVSSLGGAFIMLWQPAAGFPMPENYSEWMALSAGIGFALTNVITRKSSHLTLRTKFMAVWIGVVVMATLFIPFETMSFPAPDTFTNNQWLLMGSIGLLLMMATAMVQYGITHTPVTRASVIFLFEIVVAAVASYYLADEAMTMREWLGGSLIVMAALLAARQDSANAS
jgi:drug/metabolite transporter (DMT)-like permease